MSKNTDNKKTIAVLNDLWLFQKSERFTEQEIRAALNYAIKAIQFQEEVTNIVNSAEMIIEETYGVVIAEGYTEVFDLIKDKVKIAEVDK